MRPNPIRILLVDDDEDEFIITKDLLSEVENERYDIVWIADYEAALNALSQARHDLCLLDYRLGAQDGLELLRETSRREIKTPIILLTGQGDRAIDVEAMKAGAADYLVKGQLSAAILERAIRYALERARNLEILRASEERYRALFHSHPHPMWVHDLSTLSFLAVNAAAINRYGYSEEEFRTLTVEAIWAPVELPAALCFPAEFQDAFVQAGCRRHRRKDGSTFLVALAFHDLTFGHRPARLVLAQDISEQQRADEARRESENRYQQLIEISPDGIGLVDAKGCIGLANQQIAQILGHRHWQELVGQHIAPFVAPEDQSRVAQDLQKVRQTGSIKNVEYTFLKTDGTRFPVEVNASRVTNPDGSVLVLGVIRDLSNRKRAEAGLRLEEARTEALLHLNQMTDAPLQAISEFALKSAVQLTKSRSGCLVFLEEPGESLRVAACFEVADQGSPRQSIHDAILTPATAAPLFAALQHRQPVRMNNPVPDIAAGTFHPFEQQSIDRYLILPVFDGSRPVALVALINKPDEYVEVDSRQVTLLMDGMWKLQQHRRVEDELRKHITERIRTEEALRQAEAKYRGIFENAIEGIYQSTLDGHWLSVNPALARMLGYLDTNEFMADLNAPEKSIYVDPQRRAEFLRQLQARSILANFESQARRKDGTLIWISENARLVCGQPGETPFIEGSLENVTERKESQAAIEKLAAFPRQNPNPVLEFAAEGTLNYFNSAAAEMAQRLGRQHPAEILPPNAPDIVMDCLATGKRRLRVETVQNGRTLSWSFFPIQSSHVVHCYAGDITDRLNLEAQFRHAQKLESVGQLAAGVAHDFNNILTVIRGQASLMLAGNKRGDQATDALHQICDSTDRAMNLTRQLLAFSRRQIMQPRALNLNEVVHNIAKMLGRLLTENISLEFQSAPALPPIWADPGMMEQVLVNLAINARDAMPGGGRLLISTATVSQSEQETKGNPDARPGLFVRLTVADTGCGMDASTLSRIFEPFFTTKEVGKGTGLGLATVYGIVKQHEGWIEVNSQLGQGTQFQIFFPPSPKPAETKTSSLSPPSSRGSQECILVVEDEPKLREMIMEVLEINGYKVFGAGSGAEALALWAEHKNRIHLLLTDLVMPRGMSGRNLAEKLQAENPNLKTVYTTGYSTELSMKGFPLEEGRNFVPKPFHPDVLAQTIRYCLDH
jgi:two-component system, cell cycle sensor histidine kinase and response regulator CckA